MLRGRLGNATFARAAPRTPGGKRTRQLAPSAKLFDMDPKQIEHLLRGVASGDLDVEHAMEELRDLPFKDLGYAHVDHHRALRVGWPEVIFGQNKRVDHLIGIVREIDSRGQRALVTRVTPEQGSALLQAFEGITYDEHSRTAVLARETKPTRGSGSICIVTAGTSDQAVAEEAAVTARAFDNEVVTLFDVGVSGLHRLLGKMDTLRAARVVIVVAGMEGALASVVGGLLPTPVIAVPTSVGYGASFGGVAALLAMLNTCAAGVTVVNIDNGFGAAYAATQINQAEEVRNAGK